MDSIRQDPVSESTKGHDRVQASFTIESILGQGRSSEVTIRSECSPVRPEETSGCDPQFFPESIPGILYKKGE